MANARYSVSMTALAVAILGGGPALAQGPAAAVAPQAGAAASASGDEIIVTGSRIARHDYSASSPIVTVGTERLSQTPAVTVESTLNQMPQFTPSVGQADAFPPRGGQSQLNLRGLGTNRSLVLFDGRRIQPANADGTVDVNIIPTNLIGNIETITGGASTTYGSDAMSGVVNFIPQKNFRGLQIDAQTGMTTRNDGVTYNIAGLYGTGFADGRGSALVSLSYSGREEVQRGSREFFKVTVANARLPYATSLLSANPPSQAAVDKVFAAYGFPAGSVARTAALGTNPDGTLFSTPGNAPVVNYKGPINDSYLILNNAVQFSSARTYDIEIPLRRYNLFSKVSYNLTDKVEVYNQLFYTHYDAVVTSVPISLGTGGLNGSLPATNPFIPADLRTLLASRATPNATFPFTYSFIQLGPQHNGFKYDIGQAQLGVRGQFADWTWDVYGSVGKTKLVNTLVGNASRSAVQSLLEAPDGGKSLCNGGFNPFASDPSTLSKECIAYISRIGHAESNFDQSILEGSSQGRVFNLPAGEVRAAVGASYREDRYSQQPDALFRSGDLLGTVSLSLPSGGKETVKEIFLETLAPIIRDVPLIHALNMDIAYRYSDYSTIGAVHTYKGDLEWELTSFARMRGGYSRAIRAPSLGELFNPTSTSSVGIGVPSATATTGDPCDVRSSYRLGPDGAKVRALCLAQGVPAAAIDNYTFTSQAVTTVVSGNPKLREETADTYSIGGVVRSPFTSGPFSALQMSVDYYDISIKNAIGTLPFGTGLARCFNSAGANPTYDPTNVNCSVITRNSVGAISEGSTATLNLASYQTRGVDVQIDWRLGLDTLGLGQDAGALNLNFVATHLLGFNLVTLAGSAPLDYSGFSSSPLTGAVLPKDKFTLTGSYARGPVTVGTRLRYIGATKDISALTASSTVQNVPVYTYIDLFGTIRFGRSYEVRMGMNNVADKQPPQIGTALGSTDGATYDLLGRSFFVGVKARF